MLRAVHRTAKGKAVISDEELTAHHEAGHCALRNYFGIEIAEVWVNEARGNTRFRVPAGDIGLLQNIACSLAGKVAEDRVRGRKGKQEHGDYARAFDCALRLSAGDKVAADLLIQWAERRTELLVEKLWKQITALASALLQIKKLTGAEVKEILGNANTL
jgi:hypothetical protein